MPDDLTDLGPPPRWATPEETAEWEKTHRPSMKDLEEPKMIFKLSSEHFVCPGHGDVDRAVMHIAIWKENYEVLRTADYCIRCYMDFLDRTIGRVSFKPGPSSPPQS